ncbi:hypothetical protein [Streptomyces cyaneofuscatus]
MISEPELIGEFGPEHRPEAVGGFDHRPPTGHRRGHGLLWAVAGALTASAVWATTVFGYGNGIAERPDARGYQLGGRSCSALQLKALTASVGQREEGPALAPGRIEHPALDRIRCLLALTSPEDSDTYDKGWSLYVQAELTAELHKGTDPRSEFEAREAPSVLAGGEEKPAELVPNLGDRAYLLVDDDASRLSVLDGAAVITLTSTATMNYSGPEEVEGAEEPEEWPATPAPEAFHADLISDMRDVMKALKTAA